MKAMSHFKSTAAWRLPALGILFITVTLLTFAPLQSHAQSERTFSAKFITKFTSVVEYPFLHVTVNAVGKAALMGRTRAATDDQVVNLVDGSGTATYTLTGGNGDTLVLSLVVQPGGTINVDGGVIFSGTYTITGGTGKFTNTTGTGNFAGSGLFLTETDGIGAFAIVGTIAR